MSDINLLKLRQQVEALLASRSDLLTENRLLHERLKKVVKERAQLLTKNDFAAKTLKTIVKQIKEEFL